MNRTEEYLAWLEILPEVERAVAEQLIPLSSVEGATGPPCFRIAANPGHYGMESIRNDHGKVSLTVVHLGDSYMPGMGVAGVDPDEIVPCGCGKGIAPTAEQIASTTNSAEQRLAESQAVAVALGLDWETITPEERRAILFGHA